MKLRSKNTGHVFNFVIKADQDKACHFTLKTGSGGWEDGLTYDTLEELNEEWEDYKEPLIKDEKIRKAVRAWAEANNFSVFRVHNQHFNYVKIHGVKDRYDPNGSNIEFMGTIAGVEKRTYEIAELCGEEEE